MYHFLGGSRTLSSVLDQWPMASWPPASLLLPTINQPVQYLEGNMCVCAIHYLSKAFSRNRLETTILSLNETTILST